MKRGKSLLVCLVASAMLITIGCSKEGDPGPAGTSGANGQDGKDGKDGKNGNANVYASEWFVISPWAGTTKAYYFIRTAPEVTQGIIDSGVVLAYTKLAGGGGKVRPLPAIIGSGVTEYNFNYNLPEVGKIEFTCNLDGSISNSSMFRYVVIPSSVVENSGLNEAAIKNMEYAQAEAVFNLN